MASAPDVTSLLGGTDPVCATPQQLSPQARVNCRGSGSPESPFPPGNYTPDTHVDTGFTNPTGDIASAVQNMLGWIFNVFARIIGIAILAVSLAFGFDLFGSDHQQHIPHALQGAEQLFTLPWLPVAFAIGAILGVIRWWGHRQEGRAVGHWVLMLAMMLLGLLIVTNPQGTAGWFDSLMNKGAMASLAAFSGNDPSQPTGSYANATAELWQQSVERPWCAVEFGDINWCMSPLNNQTRQWRADVFANIRQADVGSGTVAPGTTQQERLRLQDAKTNGELWLAFPSGDDARNGKNDSWTLYHQLLAARPDLAQIRGSGGIGERLGILVICGIGMVLFILLLIFVAVNLLLASLLFALLIALAPLMALAPAFGERGRGAFMRWAAFGLGALAAKLIFAIYLGVILLASEFVGAVASETGGWMTQWILFAALWGLAFAFRSRLLGLFTGGSHHQHRGREIAAAGAGALAITRAVGRRGLTGPYRNARDRYKDSRDERRYLADVQAVDDQHRTQTERRRALGEDAEQQLTRRATAMLDAHYANARETLVRKPEILEQVAAARAEAKQLRGHRLAQDMALPVGATERDASARAVELEGQLQSAERFVHGVQDQERLTGQRYNKRQLDDARTAVEGELGSHPEHRDYEQLAYRLDGGQAAWRNANAEEKELLRGEIDRQIDADRVALQRTRQMPSAPEPPRPVEPPRPARRRPHGYRRHGEFIGARQHLPSVPRRPS